MTLIKKNTGEFLPGFRSLMGDFFDTEDFRFNDFFRKDWLPAVNILENDKNYEIEMAVPGMKKNDFHVKVEDGILNISFENKFEKEQKEKNYTRKEFGYKSFVRSFSLPENAREEDIKAHYEDGILKLMVAKKVGTPAKVKEIAIL